MKRYIVPSLLVLLVLLNGFSLYMILRQDKIIEDMQFTIDSIQTDMPDLDNVEYQLNSIKEGVTNLESQVGYLVR